MTLNARETAAELGVAERTVRRWVASGHLAAEKKNGMLLIDADEARQAHAASRSGKTSERSIEMAELRGRYAEIKETLLRVEQQLVEERRRAARLEAILWDPQPKEGGKP